MGRPRSGSENGEGDDFNAIDPNSALDAKGHAWLVFGSFWSGIKMRRLDDKTGMLSATDTMLYSLATRRRPDNESPLPPGRPAAWQAVEAPFIVRHHGYFYLFVSWDQCCRGVHSTYRTMVGRSRSITGPYVDKEGVPMMQGGGSEPLIGNTRWVGPEVSRCCCNPKVTTSSRSMLTTRKPATRHCRSPPSPGRTIGRMRRFCANSLNEPVLVMALLPVEHLGECEFRAGFVRFTQVTIRLTQLEVCLRLFRIEAYSHLQFAGSRLRITRQS